MQPAEHAPPRTQTQATAPRTETNARTSDSKPYPPSRPSPAKALSAARPEECPCCCVDHGNRRDRLRGGRTGRVPAPIERAVDAHNSAPVTHAPSGARFKTVRKNHRGRPARTERLNFKNAPSAAIREISQDHPIPGTYRVQRPDRPTPSEAPRQNRGPQTARDEDEHS